MISSYNLSLMKCIALCYLCAVFKKSNKTALCGYSKRFPNMGDDVAKLEFNSVLASQSYLVMGWIFK